MVYRGKPSAGCENCRKVKKRCGLEQPACLRCMKLNKTCSGYRDTTSLQIYDETSAVVHRAQRLKTKSQGQNPIATKATVHLPTAESWSADSSGTANADLGTMLELNISNDDLLAFDSVTNEEPTTANFLYLPPSADEIATTYFLNQFTTLSHWSHLRHHGGQTTESVDPCLALAMKACGMAALDNVQQVYRGKEYARSTYVRALNFLNDALRDQQRCKTDESLTAVAILGLFENLMCDGRQSIQSWKAHMNGAAQLLKIRGKAQFRTRLGRALYREIRTQIITCCIWDDLEPPGFLEEFQNELERQSEEEVTFVKPADDLWLISLDFARLRAKLKIKRITNAKAIEQASALERRYIQWRLDALALHERWRWRELEVADSEHVWDGKVYTYSGHPIPLIWNTFRGMRILLSRTQEDLCRKFDFSESERQQQVQYFRKTRRQLTEEICATVPVLLGHADPSQFSSTILLSANGSIWPLFFAGTCALERVSPTALSTLQGTSPQPDQMYSSPAAQAQWVMGRLEYISRAVGLKWADGVAAILRGDFKLPKDQRAASMSPMQAERPSWVTEVEKSGRGARYLIEKPSPLSDALYVESAKKADQPIWFGRLAVDPPSSTPSPAGSHLSESLGQVATEALQPW